MTNEHFCCRNCKRDLRWDEAPVCPYCKDKRTCKAIATTTGRKCTNLASLDGYCITHWRVAKEKNDTETNRRNVPKKNSTSKNPRKPKTRPKS